jgi:hypothetical protein
MLKKKVAITLACLAIGITSANLAAQRIGGEANFTARVNANDTNVYYMGFYAGTDATVRVDGDNDTDLDLYVYDEYGRLVGSDTDELDLCIVTWRPSRSGVYRIEVKNLGDVYNRFSFRTY